MTLEQRLLGYRNDIGQAQEAEFRNRDTWSVLKSAHLRMAEFANREGLAAIADFYKADAFANICLMHLTYLD